MSTQTPIREAADQIYATGVVQTSISTTTPVVLRTVTTGKSYSLSYFEFTTDAPGNTPITLQIQVKGVTIYTVLVNQLLHLCHNDVPISANAGETVQLLLSQTTAIQRLAYFIEQSEF